MDAVDDGQRKPDGPIRAAGGVVARGRDVLLVHRPRFDDWSLPKGKLKRREHPLAGAVREVFEETGVLGVPGIKLPTATYQVWADRGSRAGPPGGDRALVDKQVDYWAMAVGEAGAFRPSDEVDEVAWLPVERSLEVLSYPHDRRVVAAYSELPPLHRPVVLLRHASAGALGQRQAAALAALLPLLRPGRLVSAEPPPRRETLAALATALGLDVEIEKDFDEGVDPHRMAAALRRLADPAAATVVCSLEPPIRAAVGVLTAGRDSPWLAPADAVVLSFAGDTLIAADPFTSGVS